MDTSVTTLDTPEGSATYRAYVTLRCMIVTGELKPGEKLKIERLRNRLGTGASPIREALSLLTSDNLVERIDQRGFRAAEISTENFTEILNLRCVLEDQALRQSIANHTLDWEENLVLTHHRLQRALSADDGTFEDRHKAFHMALLANAPSPILLKFCSQLYDLNIRYRYLADRELSYNKRNISKEHTEILEATLSGDADVASQKLLDHYKNTGNYLSSLLGDGALG